MLLPTTSEARQPWLALVGPTCSGKTWFAGELLKRFPLELVNLDSYQVYSHFEVGTGRADMAFGNAHLYGFVDPWEPLSPERYVELARAAVSNIHARGHHPLFEGGSISFLRELMKVHPLRLLGIRPAGAAESDTRIRERLSGYSLERLLGEVREGLAAGYRDAPIMRDDVVYLPFVLYLEGQADLAETLERVRRNVLERQRTQLQEYEVFDVQWFSSSHDSLPALLRAAEEVLGG